MFRTWFTRKTTPLRTMADLPDAIRDEVMSICRAQALRLRDVSAEPEIDCGCLGDGAFRR